MKRENHPPASDVLRAAGLRRTPVRAGVLEVLASASGPLAVPTEGVGWADTEPPKEADNRSLVLFDRGDEVVVEAGEEGIRFLLVSGKPLEEPVAWYGPIVMNTQEQLRQAFEELDRGTFLQSGSEEKSS